MKQITNEERARIAYQYYGTKYEYRNEFGKHFGVVGDFHTNEKIKAESFRLHLKPLSAISDEDVDAAWDVCGMSQFITDGSKEYFLSVFGEKPSELNDRFGQSVYLIVYDYLRSKSYALQYLGIDLFETGIAIPQSDVK